MGLVDAAKAAFIERAKRFGKELQFS